MIRCSTGKICHDTLQMAEEALIENRIRFNHSDNSGPINVYLCHECQLYHFTSKGEVNPILKEKKDLIQREKLARNWENKLRY